MEIFVFHSQLLYMALTILYGTALPLEFASKPWISIGVGFEKILLSHYNKFCFDAGRCCAASSGEITVTWGGDQCTIVWEYHWKYTVRWCRKITQLLVFQEVAHGECLAGFFIQVTTTKVSKATRRAVNC